VPKDTSCSILLLSPLAFAQNPYHRLLKGYKLIRDSLNSPLSDCRATKILFEDQCDAFKQLATTHADEISAYHTLIAHTVPSRKVDDAGLIQAPLVNANDQLFRQFTGQPPAGIDQLASRLRRILPETDPALSRKFKVCTTALDRLFTSEKVTNDMGWPLAYVLAWLRVSGGNSVLAPWVIHQYPRVASLVQALRDTPCGNAQCSYCATTHDPRSELKRYFGFDDFRYESEQSSMQADVVLAGMRGHCVLTVLATGGGKSVCYQLPALNRFHRNASLTVVISPLQSLMKDQVDGLLGLNIASAAALNGLLTMPERADVLDRIQMGDIGILLVSPEQFRNTGFRRVIEQRQVGAWVFDEAHCLSKWGNDFRPDYLYAARYIRQYTDKQKLAPVSCFTATAKLDVLDDIRAHFKEHLEIDFQEYIGTPERPNLQFEVRPVESGAKPQAIDKLLEHYLPEQEGGAVVFVASRKNDQGLSSETFSRSLINCGLKPNDVRAILWSSQPARFFWMKKPTSASTRTTQTHRLKWLPLSPGLNAMSFLPARRIAQQSTRPGSRLTLKKRYSALITPDYRQIANRAIAVS